MLRSRALVLLPLLVSLTSLGCSDDPAAPDQVAANNGDGGSGGSGGSAGASTTGGSGGAIDPGQSTEKAYPAGPYGLNVGDVVQNLSFQGLLAPKTVDYKTDKTDKISFADYFNPTGDPSKPLALVVTGAARWCAPCKEEAKGSMGYYNYWNPKGVQFLSAVIQNENFEPSDFSDLSAWADEFSLEYPVTIDPSPPQLGAYFGADAVPFNMVIDLKTMTIVYKIAGSVVFDKNNKTLKKVIGE